MLKAKAKRRWS
ncbi:hypothetical protein MTR67_048726 [Solanum verrucosum]|uniref:Uncharacterized protein n=1 Tax=Solanum verrucosum TaxID=315347 RepID=A0AAF0V1Y5_SOLVR|nr:hypothetical protein MTR67_048726 [Solanum verrucosum]